MVRLTQPPFENMKAIYDGYSYTVDEVFENHVELRGDGPKHLSGVTLDDPKLNLDPTDEEILATVIPMPPRPSLALYMAALLSMQCVQSEVEPHSSECVVVAHYLAHYWCLLDDDQERDILSVIDHLVEEIKTYTHRDQSMHYRAKVAVETVLSDTDLIQD